MTKQSTDDIMMPGKFLALVLHLVAVTMAYFSYVLWSLKQHDNIVSAYPSISLTTDELYIGARASFMACNTLTIIFLVFEFINLFVGVTMFRERHNLIVSTLHFLGAILWSAFIFQQWQFTQLWAIWAPFSLLPLILEILTIVSVSRK